MANDPNSNSNTAFSQTSGANPFTGDLKGEFTSDFGTGTNAVSQIFKGGGFTEDRKKAIFIGLGVLLVLGLVFAYFTTTSDDSSSEDEVAEESGATDDAADTEEGEGEETAATTGEATTPTTDASTAAATNTAAAPATGAIAITSPANGAQKSYDETEGPAVFEWQGGADRIVFARNQSMTPVVRSVNLSGASSYSFNHPHPGTWYWRVENSSGASEVRSFIVGAPVRRTFPVSAPTAGGSLAGNGGVVQWQAAEKAARYRVELKPAGQSWANAPHRFGTSGTSVALKDVPAGQYDLRVGAFSEVAGRWEWQVISGVNVQ